MVCLLLSLALQTTPLQAFSLIMATSDKNKNIVQAYFYHSSHEALPNILSSLSSSLDPPFPPSYLYLSLPSLLLPSPLFSYGIKHCFDKPNKTHFKI